jgi:hypothetical protein
VGLCGKIDYDVGFLQRSTDEVILPQVSFDKPIAFVSPDIKNIGCIAPKALIIYVPNIQLLSRLQNVMDEIAPNET